MLRRIAFTVALVFTSLGFSVAGASADSCPNEQLRAENNSLGLPDCRAYELVSPQEKNGNEVTFGGMAKAAVSGEALAYKARGAFAGAQAGAVVNEYVSRRIPSVGWSTEGIIPYLTPNLQAGFTSGPGYWAFTPELTQGVLTTFHAPEEITRDTSQDQEQLYLRTASGAYSAISPAVSPAPSIYETPFYMGGSSDLNRVFFESSLSLTHDAPPPGTPELYEWAEGHLRVVGVMPDGTVSPNGVNPAVGLGDHYYETAGGQGHTINPERGISPDGTQALFATGSPSELYLRQDGAPTSEISLSQKTGSTGSPAPDGVSFAGTVSADGKKLTTVYFTSHDELTDDANTGSGAEGNDLYAYDVATGHLRDLTPDANPADANGANVMGSFGQVFVAASADGSYVYFEASGQLAPGAPENHENLYVWHDGKTTYVGPVELFQMTPEDFQLSKDGRRVTYATPERLTADDPGTNREGTRNTQVYVYDVPSATWTCVSCLHGATTPSGGSFMGFQGGSVFSTPRYLKRNISDDGRRVFFQTATPLVPQDTNGQMDVYEWEDGVVRLLSSGRSSEGANLMEAGASGDDVFIATRERLLAADQDNNVDVYDVRVGGGFPAATSRVSSCEGDSCQGPIGAPPGAPTPASESVSGSGNVSPQVAKLAVKPTRAESLARALKACRKRHKSRRRKCESQARKRYGSTRASNSRRSR